MGRCSTFPANAIPVGGDHTNRPFLYAKYLLLQISRCLKFYQELNTGITESVQLRTGII